MYAILRVDLQFWIRAVIVIEDFVDPRRTIPLLRGRKFRQIDVHRHTVVLQRQVNWLIFFMISRREGYVRQTVERNDAVRFWILDRLEVLRLSSRLVIRVTVFTRVKGALPRKRIWSIPA